MDNFSITSWFRDLYLSRLNENEEISYMISKAGRKDNPHYVLEKPDGSKLIDMTFTSPSEARKYAAKKGLKISTQKGYNMNEVEESELEAAKKEAQRISKEEGVAQHVNKVGNSYKVEDWYDSDTTVASYEDGRSLNENLSKEEVVKKDEIYKDLKKDKRDFVMRYGKDAEKVMMGRAIEMAKKELND